MMEPGEAARIISRGLQRRLEMLNGTPSRRVIEISRLEPTTDGKATPMSASLNKRVAALEAQAPGAVLPVATVWRPYGMTPAEEADFEAGLAERRKANPRQRIIVFGWTEAGEEAS
jgi:hypothetical protein